MVRLRTTPRRGWLAVGDGRGRRLVGWASNLVYDGPIAGDGGAKWELTSHWLGVGLGDCRDLTTGSESVEIELDLTELGLTVHLPVRLCCRMCWPAPGGVRIELNGTVTGPIRRERGRLSYEIHQS